MDVRLLSFLIVPALGLDAQASHSRTAVAEVLSDGSSQGDRWRRPPAPPDPTRPQPLANTGTMNPLTCYDTVAKEEVPCFSFVDVRCKPWTSSACQCDAKRPICVTDVAERASPASPANKRSSTKTQYACCPQPRTT
ncbi:Pyruvate [Durusdinium trenchii]|uniref:Chloroplastic n=1 Tax=Durusdinium trenchii TaxID=1381693 RepID=A0ABP0HN44_9DINO